MMAVESATPPTDAPDQGGDPKQELKDLLMRLLAMLDDGGEGEGQGSDVTSNGGQIEPGDTQTPDAGSTDASAAPPAAGGPAGPAGGPPDDLKAKLAMLMAKKGGAMPPVGR